MCYFTVNLGLRTRKVADCSRYEQNGSFKEEHIYF